MAVNGGIAPSLLSNSHVAEKNSLEETSNTGPTYCICGGPEDGNFMLACDLCNEWFHARCVNIREEDAKNIDFICEQCREGDYDPKERVDKKPHKRRIPRGTEPDAKKVKYEEDEIIDEEEQQSQEDPAVRREKEVIIRKLSKKLAQEDLCSIEEATEHVQNIMEALNELNLTSLERNERIRLIMIHIEDPKNTRLREQIINKNFTPKYLCTAPAIDLASNKEDLIAEEKRLQDEYLSQIIIKKEDNPIYRKTHKGEELIESDDTVIADSYSEFTDAVALRKLMEGIQDSAPKTKNSPKNSDNEDKEQNEEQEKKLEEMKENLGVAELLEDSQINSAPAPIPVSIKESHDTKKPLVYSQPITWQGFITEIPDLQSFGAKAVHICGKHVGRIFGLKDLTVIGRMRADACREYIDRLDYSTKCKRAALYILPESPEHEEAYHAMYKKFLEANRVAVIQPAGFDGIREIFVVPFPAHNAVPSFIEFKGNDAVKMIKDAKDKLLCIVVYYSTHSAKPKASFSPTRDDEVYVESSHLPTLPDSPESKPITLPPNAGIPPVGPHNNFYLQENMLPYRPGEEVHQDLLQQMQTYGSMNNSTNFGPPPGPMPPGPIPQRVSAWGPPQGPHLMHPQQFYPPPGGPGAQYLPNSSFPPPGPYRPPPPPPYGEYPQNFDRDNRRNDRHNDRRRERGRGRGRDRGRDRDSQGRHYSRTRR